MEKLCRRCSTVKTGSEFHRRARASDGLQQWCKDCFRKYFGRKAAKPPILSPEECAGMTADEVRGERQWRTSLRKKYGLEHADYQRMLSEQGGVCAICRQPETATYASGVKRLSVDHDHAIGRSGDAVRGLLCTLCNTMIGHARDDASRLRSGAEYLEGWRRD